MTGMNDYIAAYEAEWGQFEDRADLGDLAGMAGSLDRLAVLRPLAYPAGAAYPSWELRSAAAVMRVTARICAGDVSGVEVLDRCEVLAWVSLAAALTSRQRWLAFADLADIALVRHGMLAAELLARLSRACHGTRETREPAMRTTPEGGSQS